MQVNDNEFVISFIHKPQADISTKYYYAFTFPFTYTECQNQLARFDSLYHKSDEEMNYILRRLNVDVDVNCNTINFENNDAECVENVQNLINGMKFFIAIGRKANFKLITQLFLFLHQQIIQQTKTQHHELIFWKINRKKKSKMIFIFIVNC